MKNEYDLLNGAHTDLNEYDDIELTDIEKQKLKRNMQKKIKSTPVKKIYKKPLIVAALSLAVLSPVILSNERVLASIARIGQQIEMFINKPEDSFNGYKKTISQSVEDRNIQVTMNEIMLDDGQILLNMNVKMNEDEKKKLGINPKSYIQPGEVKIGIDDMEFFDSASSIQREENADGSWDYLYKKRLDRADTNGDGLLDIEQYNVLDSIDPEKDYTVKVSFNNMEYEKVPLQSGRYSDFMGEIKGNWTFETSINGSKIKSDTRVYSVNKKIPIKDKEVEGILTIKEIRVSPVSLKISHTFEYSKGYRDGSIPIHVDIMLKDENGRKLVGSGTGGGNHIMEMTNEYEVGEDLQKITITPFISDHDKETTQYFDNQSFEVDLTGEK
ncbi:DUF4179 domain-containing protein [Bacillus massiliigorillae]|uniref:DUF4179 domain-containing protein n=1 Tax=Bacillus massiliigorillae TaxID=1243664 RepID=UPI0003A2CB75|nr:DUF4179 domain-containing protein [Bacillus massiliigorillae]